MARITTTPIAGAPVPYVPSQYKGRWKFDVKMDWEFELEREEQRLRGLRGQLANRRSKNKRIRLLGRITSCEAAILALKLAHS